MENKLIELTSQLQEAVSLISSKLVESAPKAYELLLMVKMVDSAQNLVLGIISLIVALAIGLYIPGYFKRINEYNENVDYFKRKEPHHLFWMLPVLVITVTTTMSTLLHVWNYVGIIKPELAIANDLINMATKAARQN